MPGTHAHGAEKLMRVQRARAARRWRIVAGLALLCAILAVASLTQGASQLSWYDSIAALCGAGPAEAVASVRSIRLPRVICALVAGAGLGIAGAVLQSVLENPLASASTIGISQGAAFGATLAMLTIIPALTGPTATVGMGAVALCAFAGAMTSAAVALAFSSITRMRPEAIILVGVALSALWAGAGTILQYFADDVSLARVVFWQFGDLGKATWGNIALMSLSCVACSTFFLYQRWTYNALAGGGAQAEGLGVNVTAVRLASVAAAALLCASIVSFIGLVGFIGLVAPHIARRIVGPDHRFLLPCSLIMGACLMVASDLVARTAISPVILPIGAITSFLGAPLFLHLLYRGVRR
ncbi:iron ABC transporter permease [Eggerthellaceae bacterium zg-1084]|uniref:FecCD family ABC transporter permease n=1 Tax=Berryella wangjianweii TaxID=2734634 RepID=UPI001551F757|nr:iron ABC transporter permease [Berryella wangjianweii]NPD31181.1 iron ABC transporter permease [Berryella wangjianweii]